MNSNWRNQTYFISTSCLMLIFIIIIPKNYQKTFFLKVLSWTFLDTVRFLIANDISGHITKVNESAVPVSTFTGFHLFIYFYLWCKIWTHQTGYLHRLVSHVCCLCQMITEFIQESWIRFSVWFVVFNFISSKSYR